MLAASASRKSWQILVCLSQFPRCKHHSVALAQPYNISLNTVFPFSHSRTAWHQNLDEGVFFNVLWYNVMNHFYTMSSKYKQESIPCAFLGRWYYHPSSHYASSPKMYIHHSIGRYYSQFTPHFAVGTTWSLRDIPGLLNIILHLHISQCFWSLWRRRDSTCKWKPCVTLWSLHTWWSIAILV